MKLHLEWVHMSGTEYERLLEERDEARRIARALYRVLLASEAYVGGANVLTRGVEAVDLLVETGRARRIIGS